MSLEALTAAGGVEGRTLEEEGSFFPSPKFPHKRRENVRGQKQPEGNEAHPVCALEHLQVQWVSLDLPVQQQKRMARRHGSAEWPPGQRAPREAVHALETEEKVGISGGSLGVKAGGGQFPS